MDKQPDAGSPNPNGQRLQKEVGRKAARKLKARGGEKHTPWFWLGMFGLVGWSIAIPTIIGIALGMWLDRHLDGTVSWTLTLLLTGSALGCLNAWYWIKQEGHGD